MTPALDIRGSGSAFFIWANGAAVAGPYTSNGNAIAALRGVERRLNPETARYRCCNNCGAGFITTGKMLCPDCLKEGKRHG